MHNVIEEGKFMEKINNKEINEVMCKTLEIYEKIKDIILSMDDQKINLNDKKILSLFLGIIHTDNSVSDLFLENGYEYSINLTIPKLSINYYECCYNENFKDIIDSFELDDEIELKLLMMKMLELDFVKKFNESKGYSIEDIKYMLNKSLKNNIKIKTLQK